MKKLAIVFDVDHTLAIPKAQLSPEAILYFLRKSAFFNALNEKHYLLVGAKELITYLLKKENIDISFFSSAAKERNEEFVGKLMMMCLPDVELGDQYPLIGSEGDLERSECYTFNMEKHYGIGPGNYKKNICKVLKPGQAIQDTIFVEDEITYAISEQVKCLLRPPLCGIDCLDDVKHVFIKKQPGHEAYLSHKFMLTNSIFYVAGMIAECITRFELGESVTDFLFQYHFEKNNNNLFCYQPTRGRMSNRLYYEKGLELLRTVNPALSFVTPEDYIEVTAQPITEAEEKILSEWNAQKNSARHRVGL